MQKRYGIHILFILAVCFFAFFVNNGAVHVNSPEARNLVTAREMVEYHNWATPTLNGESRMRNPPLPAWLAAVVEQVSPDNLILQRTVAGGMATLAVFFLYMFAIALTRSKLFGLLSALVLATCFSMVMMGRAIDGYSHAYAFMLGTIFFFYRAAIALRTRWWDFVTAGLLLGLSFLSKGLELFYTLFLPFLVAFFVLYRPSFRHKLWPTVLMLLVGGIVGSVWLWFALRSGAPVEPFMEMNARPWYYYWRFFTESGIWSLFLLTGLCGWCWIRERIALKKEYAFTVLWLLLALLLLTLFPGKSMRYLPSVLIPAALVIGHYVVDIFLRVRDEQLTPVDKIVFRLNAFLPALLSLCVPVALYVMFYSKLGLFLYMLFSFLFLLVSLSIFTGGIKFKPLKVFSGMMVMMILVETFLICHLADTFNNPEKNTIRAVRQMEELRDLPFYHPAGEALRVEVVYEAGRRIVPLDLGSPPSSCSLPAILVSSLPAEQVLPEAWLERIAPRQVGYYDNNSFRSRSSGLLCYVTLLEEREGATE
ncbi:MAG: glycosyltransferase family 39 protein [Odoribacteraceae bacterium]|jgi:4-amino-4-deoxy-L-arabinose transferase-like glycosyltransferase|nr:glycosyltransferase family 39 protein [Odoribacteraceae bacterium]